ncbi:hypothetical protein Tco_0217122 [Tanacetum coccineum]
MSLTHLKGLPARALKLGQDHTQTWTHKGAANFKGKPLPFYEKLCTIFGKDRVAGSRAIDLGDDDVVHKTLVSPIDVDIERPMATRSNKLKRSKSIEFIETFKDCSKDLIEKMEHSIGGLGEKLMASANQDIILEIWSKRLQSYQEEDRLIESGSPRKPLSPLRQNTPESQMHKK